MGTASIARTREAAERLASGYERIVRGESYEPKGVLFSEMLFVLAATDGLQPRMVFESGRARAQSTRLLALCFPEARIVSVEWRRDSTDVEVARERLAGLPNVELLFGDARAILPRRVEPGDVVLVDGPKGFRAVRLALALLARRRPALVFVHDVERGLAERSFVEARVPGAFFSDDPAFVEGFRRLDERCWSAMRENHLDGWGAPFLRDGAVQESYGPTLACLPWQPGVPYGRLAFSAWWASQRRRWRRRLARN